MNDFTSWDNYSDNSDEDNDIYNTTSINETTKKLLLRKYTQYVKEALTVFYYLTKQETELSEIMSQCKYKDEEIKSLIDEKLNTLNNKVNCAKGDWKNSDKDNRKFQSKTQDIYLFIY